MRFSTCFTAQPRRLINGLAIGLLLASCSAPDQARPPGQASQPAQPEQTSQPAAVPAGPIFVTLGTGGGPVIRRQRSEPANALVVGRAVYLFDAGAGTIHQLVAAKLPLQQLRAVFISHHHIDHNAGLAPLLLNRWLLSYQPLPPLPIVGPPGTAALVRGLTAAYHAAERAPITDDGAPKPTLASTLAPRELPPDPAAPQLVYQDENIKVLAVTNTHYHFPAGSPDQRFSRSYSYRIETPQRTIVFTGDTGPSANVVALAQGADLLVSEVIDVDQTLAMEKKMMPPAALKGATAHLTQDHLTPAEVGKLAQAAGVKQVVLTHLGPGSDGETDLSGYTKGLNTYYKGPVQVAQDLGRY